MGIVDWRYSGDNSSRDVSACEIREALSVTDFHFNAGTQSLYFEFSYSQDRPRRQVVTIVETTGSGETDSVLRPPSLAVRRASIT